ncbi:response regulator [Nocardia concava]|uniref:response regulator n=1 Tax=Nocardia concava TaxID=257281 RepID=UPI0002D9EBDB|nr:response regulator transcription factor [Nocardia concava]
MTIRVVLADDQEMVRMGFAMILNAAEDIEVVAECADGVDAVEAIRTHRPDVALLDIRMPKLDGLAVTKAVAHLTKVVIVTTFDHDEYVDTALAHGASGFLLKGSGAALLLAGVRAAASGDALISPELTVRLLERTRGAGRPEAGPVTDPGVGELTDREAEVARLVARGRTNTEIAEELVIALGTVKSHLANIQTRLGVRNRVEIAARVWESGLMN